MTSNLYSAFVDLADAREDLLTARRLQWKSVPVEIDRATCRPMLDVWNAGLENCETLEMLWPKLVAAAPEIDVALWQKEIIAESLKP